MKKLFLIGTILFAGAWMLGVTPVSPSSAGPTAVYAQKKDDKKKDPAGPPVVRDKRPDPRPKNPPPPRKDRKP